MKNPLAVSALALLAAAGALRADEAQLKNALEGQRVQVLLDLPASTKGLDLYVAGRRPYDAAKLDVRLVSDGIGVRSGSVVVITKIKAKSDLVELHFGAGGSSQKPARPSSYVPKSELERELEDQIKKATTDEEKNRLQRMLASERTRRQREERLQRSLADQQHQLALSQRTEEEWDLMAGSRINLRYEGRVPPEVLTPEGLRAALQGYVDFDAPAVAPAVLDAGSDELALVASASDPAELPFFKGQSRGDLDAVFGGPESCHEEAQGVLEVTTCTYLLDEATLEAQFVDGVLVRYVLTSN